MRLSNGMVIFNDRLSSILTQRRYREIINLSQPRGQPSSGLPYNVLSHNPILHKTCVLYMQHTDKAMNSQGHSIPHPTWWRHQVETFSVLLALCAGIHRSPVNSPYKGQWRGSLVFFMICAWTNGWTNNRSAGDLRRHRAHYGVTVLALDELWSI